MNLKVDAIRECLEGAAPALMATADLDGTPNISYLSQIQYIDSEHVALSYQFFNKTRKNVLINPHAAVLAMNPLTGAQYRLTLQYLRTETSGPLFESMKAKLAGIASHTGMSGVFRLLGSDVFHVSAVQRVPGEPLPPPPRRNFLAVLRAASERLAAHCDLEHLLTDALACLDTELDIRHAMILLHDEPNARLYTVASRGYPASGVGSEIALGEGVIGVSARERTPIRIGHMSSEYAYSRAIRESARESGLSAALETEIPLPGLTASRSQLAVPMVLGPHLVGVLYVESPLDLRFTYDDEDVLVTLAAQLGMAVHMLQSLADEDESPPHESGSVPLSGPPLLIRHYAENDSVFFGDEYLIKGVAGSIFWTLIRDYVDKNRCEFSNRELRLDARIKLPDVSDNLEARLILLGRRLAERDACILIEKAGRGRVRLCVNRAIKLHEEARH